ncbi:hypothetical protein OTU49_002242, partial [Cherax quadricarinatus]
DSDTNVYFSQEKNVRSVSHSKKTTKGKERMLSAEKSSHHRNAHAGKKRSRCPSKESRDCKRIKIYENDEEMSDEEMSDEQMSGEEMRDSTYHKTLVKKLKKKM